MADVVDTPTLDEDETLENPIAEAPTALPRPVAAPYADQDGVAALLLRGKRVAAAELEAFRQKHVDMPPATPPKMARKDVQLFATEEATRQGVDPALVHAVIGQESAYNPHALSRAKAKGVMQLMDGTAQRFGVTDSWDPEQNITGGIKYLKFLQEKFPGRIDLQLAGYNAGEGAVQKYNGIPPFPETQDYVSKIMGRLGQPKPAQLSAATGPRPEGAPFKDVLPPPGVKPAQIAAATGPRPPGLAFVDVGVTAPGAVAGNARSLASGFFRAIGSTLRTPGNIAEIVSPLLPDAVTDIAGQLPIGGLPLGALTTLWSGLGEAAEAVSANLEVPEAHKTFANKLSETAGAMAAYVIPAFATGGSTLVMTGLEGFGEANEVYEALKPVVGQAEAATRAGKTLAANLVVLGITNKLGIGRQAKTVLGKVVGGVVGEDVQEVIQYETQRRQFWLPSEHPKAAALKAHGWHEANGRVYQPFSASTVGEILAISSVLGGGVAFIEGMTLGQKPVAEVQAATQRIQTQDTQEVSAQIPESVVRQGADRSVEVRIEDVAPPVGPPGTPGPPEEQQRELVPTEPLARLYPVLRSGEPQEGSRFTDTPTGETARPVYLDIRHPAVLPESAAADATPDLAALEAQGYDGIVQEDGQGGQQWTPFSPEQVIPAFELDALLELSRAEVQAAAATTESTVGEALPPLAPRAPRALLARWRGYLHAEMGGVAFPGGGEPLASLEQRIYELDTLIATNEELGEPTAPLIAQRDALLRQLLDTEATPSEVSPPPLPAQEEPSPLAQHLEATTPQGTLNLRDAQGRWRIPLKRIPNTELELQDFIRKHGGINLADETDVPGELRDLVSRKETGIGGLQNNRSGQSLQGMAEMATEFGFLTAPDKTALLDALDQSVRQGELVYSQQATGVVPGIADFNAEPDAPRPQQPAPPITGPSRSVVVLTGAQQRMQERAESLSNFLEGDRVEFQLPNGQHRQGRILATSGPMVTVGYGRRSQELHINVLDEASQPLRLRLTKAQLEAEAAGIVDLPLVLTEQINAILQQPDRPITGRITGINFEHIQSPNDVKRYIADLMAASALHVREMRRETISRAQLLAMAEENIAKKRFTIDTLLQREPGQTFSPEDVLAARLIGTSVAEELAARVQAYTADPTPTTEDALLKFFPLANEIFAQWSGLAAETGRSLGAFAPNVTGELHYIEEVGDRLTSLPTGMTTEEFATHLGGLKTNTELLAALAKTPTWGDMFLAGLYGTKLMAATTDVKNVTGSAAAYFWNTAVRGVAAQKWLGFSGEVQHGESTAMLYGWYRANMMLWKLWGDLSEVALRDRPRAVAQAAADRIGFDTLFDRLKTEGLAGEQQITGANVRARGAMSGPVGQMAGSLLAGGRIRSAMIDFVGSILHFSGAKLNAEDVVAKVYNYMGEGYAQAYREAMTQETPLDGEALSNWMDDYVMNMKGTVKERAKDMAFEHTLTEALGPRAANIESFLHATPPLRLAILFFRTPMNAARWAVRNSPLGLLAQKNQEMLARGGADADIARARIALGSTVILTTAMMGLMGLITGRQAGNPESRKLLTEDTKQPDYAVWVPGVNRWVSYDWFDPLSTIFGTGADLAGMVKHGEFRDSNWWETLGMGFAAAVLTVGQNVLSRTWMQGARQVLDMLVPSPHVTPDTQESVLARFLKNQERSLLTIPPVRQLTLTIDPVIRETADWLDILRGQVPFLSETLPPSHNKLGYIRLHKDALGPDYISPVQSPSTDVNPVFQELGRLVASGHLRIPDTPRIIKAGRDTIQLTAQEISDLELMIAGGNPSVTGKPGRLEVALARFMKTAMYQDRLSDMGRGEELRKLMMEFQDQGREQFLHKTPRVREEKTAAERQRQRDYYQRPQVGQ